jgi:hypothetical protein
MKLTVEGSTIVIEKNIKSLQNFQEIKKAVESVSETSDKIHFELKDTISMISSVIGYLTKVIQKDGLNISMTVYDERLYHLLDELNLVQLFQVSKGR